MYRRGNTDPIDIVIGSAIVLIAILISSLLIIVFKYFALPLLLFALLIIYFGMKLITRPRERYITIEDIRRKVLKHLKN